MEYITRKQFDQMFHDQNEIKAEDLVYVLEEKLGYTVSLEKKPQLTGEQRQRITDYIFSNEDILEQLQKSSNNQDYIRSDEEALKIIHGARDGK